MMIRRDDFDELITTRCTHGQDFKPTVTYDADGDLIEFVSAPDSFYAERVDDLITVYYSHDTGKICGGVLKSWGRFQRDVLGRFPGLRLEIEDGPVRLEFLFRAHLWSLSEKLPKLAYRKLHELIDAADDADAKATLALG